MGIELLSEFTFRSLDSDNVSFDVDGDTSRDGNRFSTNSRHVLSSLPDVGEHFAANVELSGFAIGHDSARSGDDGDTKSI